MIISTSLLATLYMAMGFSIFNGIGFKELTKGGAFKNISSARLVYTVLLGLAFSIALIGIIFKLQFWPGASFQISFGITGLAIGFIAMIIGSKDQQFKFKNTLRIVPVLAVGIALYLIPTSKRIEAFMPPGTEYLKKAYENLEANPQDPGAREAVDAAWERYHNSMQYPPLQNNDDYDPVLDKK